MTESLLACLMLQQQTSCQPGLSCAPSITAALLCLLSQSYYGQPHNADRYESKTEYGGAIMACIDYIDHHYKEPLNAADLSKRFGISRSVLFATFPQFAGMPLRQYIARKRISEAQMLIRSRPELRLGQIAALVGFDDISSFYRNFLKVTGMSPSKYRELHVPKD
jgi:YesN/AraC family two-component response regulator